MLPKRGRIITFTESKNLFDIIKVGLHDLREEPSVHRSPSDAAALLNYSAARWFESFVSQVSGEAFL